MRTEPIRLRQSESGALLLVRDGRGVPVKVRRCFPWREPSRYISLCDDDNKELALIEDPSRLDEASRENLDQALALAGFTLPIERVIAIEEEIELRTWKVQVGGVVRHFQTELDEWPRALPGNRILIKDVSGDLYTIHDPEQLDAKSRKLLWALSG